MPKLSTASSNKNEFNDNNVSNYDDDAVAHGVAHSVLVFGDHFNSDSGGR